MPSTNQTEAKRTYVVKGQDGAWSMTTTVRRKAQNEAARVGGRVHMMTPGGGFSPFGPLPPVFAQWTGDVDYPFVCGTCCRVTMTKGRASIEPCRIGNCQGTLAPVKCEHRGRTVDPRGVRVRRPRLPASAVCNG